MNPPLCHLIIVWAALSLSGTLLSFTDEDLGSGRLGALLGSGGAGSQSRPPTGHCPQTGRCQLVVGGGPGESLGVVSERKQDQTPTFQTELRGRRVSQERPAQSVAERWGKASLGTSCGLLGARHGPLEAGSRDLAHLASLRSSAPTCARPLVVGEGRPRAAVKTLTMR